MNEVLSTLLLIAGAGVVCVYPLLMRDLIRRGRLHRRNEELRLRAGPAGLSEGRVACPECAEAILPQARRCPYCRSVIAGAV